MQDGREPNRNSNSLVSSPCANSVANREPPERFTKAEAAFLVARIISVYHEKKGASIPALVAEWHDALRFFTPNAIEAGWRKVRNRSKFWPTPAEVREAILEDVAPLGRRYEPREPWPPFCRDGRTVAEEIAWRTNYVAELRRRSGL